MSELNKSDTSVRWKPTGVAIESIPLLVQLEAENARLRGIIERAKSALKNDMVSKCKEILSDA